MTNVNSNIQITATPAEFQNGNKGYTVEVKGLDNKLNCKRNFTEPLKAMRYMFLLSKRLDLQIEKLSLTAVSISYQRAKEALAKAQQEVQDVVKNIKESAEIDEDECVTIPLPSEDDDTDPIIKQYQDLKKKHPGAKLIFHCGDFYEAYDEDAVDIANILGITLTVRAKDKRKMCGFPYHALDTYLPKIIRAGHRVAICDQIEAPKSATE